MVMTSTAPTRSASARSHPSDPPGRSAWAGRQDQRERTGHEGTGDRRGPRGLATASSRLGVAGYAVSQLLLLGGLWMVYGMARHLTAGDTARAYSNAVDVWHFERLLSLPGEDTIQGLVIHAERVLTLANWYYVGVHFPVAVLFGLWVFVRHRDSWARVRNVVVLTTAVALVVHVLYPLAPPRLLPEVLSGPVLVDTGAVFGPSPYAKGSGLANQFAAMPSLHVGWALIEAWGVVTILRSRARWLAAAQPVLTFTVVVVTANHYWVDGLVAIVLVVATVRVCRLVEGRLRDGQHVDGQHVDGRPVDGWLVDGWLDDGRLDERRRDEPPARPAPTTVARSSIVAGPATMARPAAAAASRSVPVPRAVQAARTAAASPAARAVVAPGAVRAASMRKQADPEPADRTRS